MALQDLSVLENPMDLPPEFKAWLIKYLELNPPNLPVAQMLGVGGLSDKALATPVLRLEAGGTVLGGTAAGSLIENHDSVPVSAGALTNFVAQKFAYNAKIDGPPAGYKTQWLLEVVWRTNATSPGTSFTIAPWEQTAFAGGAGGYTSTGAGALNTPTAVTVTPGAGASGNSDSGWHDHGVAGDIVAGKTYFIDCLIAGATAANSGFDFTTRLWRRFVPA